MDGSAAEVQEAMLDRKEFITSKVLRTFVIRPMRPLWESDGVTNCLSALSGQGEWLALFDLTEDTESAWPELLLDRADDLVP